MKRTLFLLILIITSPFCYSIESADLINRLYTQLKNKTPKDSIRESIDSGLWNKDKNFFVSSIDVNNSILVYAFSFYKGEVHFIDASYIADIIREFKWAQVKAEDKKEVIPTKILNCNYTRCLVEIRKRVWVNGQRYTQLRPLAIGLDGTIYKQ